jgi:hypothetical protein
MNKRIDFSYQISDERLLAWSKVPILEKLKMLDDLRRFTLAVRAAPLVNSPTLPTNPSASPSG